MIRAAILALALLAGPAFAQAGRVDRLIAEADALKGKGDVQGAYTKAREAAALAAANTKRDPKTHYKAAERLTDFSPTGDLAATLSAYEAFIPIADQVKGRDSFEGHSARAVAELSRVFLGGKGGSLDAAAEHTAKAVPLARGDKDRFGIASLTIMLGQFYENGGNRTRARELIALGSPIYDKPPTPLNVNYAGGLVTMGKIYATFGEWDRAFALNTRAIAAFEAVEGPKGDNLVPPLIQQSIIHQRRQQFTEAEALLRRAVSLADSGRAPMNEVGALLALGRFHVATGQDALAAPPLLRAAEVAKPFPAGSSLRIVALSELYQLALRANDLKLAMAHANAAREDVVTRTLKGGDTHVATLLMVANAAVATGDLPTARAALAEADPMLGSAAARNGERRFEWLVSSARAALAEKDAPRAAALLREGLTIMAARPQRSPVEPEANRLLARALLDTGDRPGAWTAARTGADLLGRLLVAQGARSDSPTRLVLRDRQTLDTALDAAWARDGQLR